MTNIFSVDHPAVIDLAESIKGRGIFTSRSLDSDFLRTKIAHIVLNTPWFKEFARRVAHEAWKHGNEVGWQDADAYAGGGLTHATPNPHLLDEF